MEDPPCVNMQNWSLMCIAYCSHKTVSMIFERTA
uniref:Uncharacterized protein n=1 Tax=Rhizophora mucronata TaxID=61149 RepID=A0A2P2R491_RHIMU